MHVWSGVRVYEQILQLYPVDERHSKKIPSIDYAIPSYWPLRHGVGRRPRSQCGGEEERGGRREAVHGDRVLRGERAHMRRQRRNASMGRWARGRAPVHACTVRRAAAAERCEGQGRSTALTDDGWPARLCACAARGRAACRRLRRAPCRRRPSDS